MNLRIRAPLQPCPNRDLLIISSKHAAVRESRLLLLHELYEPA